MQFNSRKQEEMTRGRQIRRVRRVGDRIHDFSGQTLLHCQRTLRRRIVMVNEPLRSAIAPDVFGGLALSDVAKSPGSSAG